MRFEEPAEKPSAPSNKDIYAEYGGAVYALGASLPDGESTDADFGSFVAT